MIYAALLALILGFLLVVIVLSILKKEVSSISIDWTNLLKFKIRIAKKSLHKDKE